jgi:hypothetical protein
LPFWRVILGFRKLGDEGRGITQGDKLAAVRQHDRFVKLAVRKGNGRGTARRYSVLIPTVRAKKRLFVAFRTDWPDPSV